MRGKIKITFLLISLSLFSLFPVCAQEILIEGGTALNYPGFWRGTQPAGINTVTLENYIGLNWRKTGFTFEINSRNAVLSRESPYNAGLGDMLGLFFTEELPFETWPVKTGFGLNINIYSSIFNYEFGSLVLEPVFYLRYPLEKGSVKWETVFDTTPTQNGFYHGFTGNQYTDIAELYYSIHWASNYLKQDSGNLFEKLFQGNFYGVLASLIPLKLSAKAVVPLKITDLLELNFKLGIQLTPYRSYNFNSIYIDAGIGIKFKYL